MKKLLENRVIVQKTVTKEKKTESGIIVDRGVKDGDLFEGIVKFVGTVKDVEIGDRVVFTKFAGTNTIIDGVNYLIMRETDIMCIL